MTSSQWFSFPPIMIFCPIMEQLINVIVRLFLQIFLLEKNTANCPLTQLSWRVEKIRKNNCIQGQGFKMSLSCFDHECFTKHSNNISKSFYS